MAYLSYSRIGCEYESTPSYFNQSSHGGFQNHRQFDAAWLLCPVTSTSCRMLKSSGMPETTTPGCFRCMPYIVILIPWTTYRPTRRHCSCFDGLALGHCPFIRSTHPEESGLRQLSQCGRQADLLRALCHPFFVGLTQSLSISSVTNYQSLPVERSKRCSGAILWCNRRKIDLES